MTLEANTRRSKLQKERIVALVPYFCSLQWITYFHFELSRITQIFLFHYFLTECNLDRRNKMKEKRNRIIVFHLYVVQLLECELEVPTSSFFQSKETEKKKSLPTLCSKVAKHYSPRKAEEKKFNFHCTRGSKY